jgi:hypothetical protein
LKTVAGPSWTPCSKTRTPFTSTSIELRRVKRLPSAAVTMAGRLRALTAEV